MYIIKKYNFLRELWKNYFEIMKISIEKKALCICETAWTTNIILLIVSFNTKHKYIKQTELYDK